MFWVSLLVLFSHLCANHKDQPKTISDLKVGDIIEDDIMVDHRFLRRLKGSRKRGFIHGLEKWPRVMDEHGKSFIRIPYELRTGWFWSGLSSGAVNALKNAIKRFNEETCIRFVPKKDSDNDYLYIYPGTGCWSLIGKRGGKQPLSVGEGCGYKGHVMHELMHALGFLHEQTRMDRDEHITVHKDRIFPERMLNFKKYHQDTSGLPYDFRSLVHYSNYDSSASGQPTMEALTDPYMKLGRKNDFSPGDIVKINMLYNCPQLSNDLVDYNVRVVTANVWTAGTNANVEMDIIGENGAETGEKRLETGGSHDDFERGSDKTLSFAAPYVGKIKSIKIRLYHTSGWFNGWKPVKFVVEDPKTHDLSTFMFNKWIYPGEHEALKVTTVEHKGK
ncbi:zinc metalloproteinase nas-4 isoform X3 [Nematostella vectensis]|uniref:zinc metalloproteinase nas-4 isoform X2 n=1 Tax=Nematostella vectensis TaxID=45351 RepID=UPI00207730E4|nr:zinc metalloproteinase nas-4 isoform X2 [Nematostella vectensis]XP_048585156.1 zinc metalloproteinase nas-4 isoform X3 [Nematostella vectensis]